MPDSPDKIGRHTLQPPASLPSHTEFVWLAGAMLCGIVLRWGSLGLLAIEHHDEGVYASNLLFGAEAGSQFPGRPFYAPPLLPFLIETTTLVWTLLGLPRTAWLPMLPGLVAGTLLIPSAWWVSRRWFSPLAGLVAAWIVALSGYHAYYSRTALTDPLLVFWLLWAVYWVWQSLGDGRVKSAALAGVLTALAWGTKYTGWLPLAIATAGGVCYVCLLPPRDRNWRQLAQTLAIMTCVTVLLWIPVWFDCQSVGGYAAVTANHRGYLQGSAAWPDNWLRQNANIAWYDAHWSLMGWGIAGVMAGLILWQRGPEPTAAALRRAGPIVLIGAVLCLCGWPLAGELWCGGWAVCAGWRAWRQGLLSPAEMRAGCLLAAWFAGLFLTTPLYQPFPRLALPLWLAGSLGVGWWWHRCQIASTPRNAELPPVQGVRPALTVAVAAPVLVGLGAALWPPLAPVWEPRTGTRDVVRAWQQQFSGNPAKTVVYVYGDPGLFFELSQAGFAASPRGDLQVTRVPQADDTLLIPGWNADRQTEFVAEWEQLSDRFELLAEILVQPSTLVWFDASSPPTFRQSHERSGTYRIYRVR